jgi:3-(methylsulfanyl)propanoyl-CoA dehydrogenase
MSTRYSPPLQQQKFLLEHVHGLPDILRLDGSETETETCWTILDSAARFAVDVLSPLNSAGDRAGCRLDGHDVIMPPGFKAGYDAFVAQGWPALSAPSHLGGQGMPRLLQLAVSEMIIGACLSFSMLPLQQRAAAAVLTRHGDPDSVGSLINDIVSGRCGATITMTEPNAGSDAGRGRTRAVARADGRFDLHGSKVFISFADHDLTAQIVHLVLAREPGGAEDGRGLSLFLVRKWLDEAHSVRNAAYVTAIEHKMGLKASPTCVLSLDGAIGERIGPAGKGLATIFTMVNVMRLDVAMHGIAIGHAAYARARAYAEERLQGDDAGGNGPVALIAHPDVRRNLMTMRARVEGMRGLIFEVARQLDLAERLPAPARDEARALAELLLPVCKAAGSEVGFEAANLALQIFGGYGYVTDTGIEQYVRDIRVASIFEGTTGIQAIDLLTRKLVDNDGRRWTIFIRTLRDDVARMAGRDDVAAVAAALDALQETADILIGQLAHDRARALGGATPFLQMVAVVALGWTWLRLRDAGIANALPDPGLGDVAGFFFLNIFPAYRLYRHQAVAGSAALG